MEENKKASYEDLKAYCDQLMAQNKVLMQRFTQISGVMNVLPFLFQVVTLKSEFEEGFVTRCKKEITEILTPDKSSEVNNEQIKA